MKGSDVTIKVGTETKDIIDGIKDLIEDIRAGKDIGMIAKENLPNLINIVDDIDEVPEELKYC